MLGKVFFFLPGSERGQGRRFRLFFFRVKYIFSVFFQQTLQFFFVNIEKQQCFNREVITKKKPFFRECLKKRIEARVGFLMFRFFVYILFFSLHTSLNGYLYTFVR